ncbi:unannotated protein [freshwater metagenome]|uniref:Unannotated protein n=1 Tax=freshwater metagenome TaxID=449393 RepID=A0A6J7EH09_9ZZZZ
MRPISSRCIKGAQLWVFRMVSLRGAPLWASRFLRAVLRVGALMLLVGRLSWVSIGLVNIGRMAGVGRQELLGSRGPS